MNSKKAEEKAIREFRQVVALAIAIRHLKRHREAQAKLKAKAGSPKSTDDNSDHR